MAGSNPFIRVEGYDDNLEIYIYRISGTAAVTATYRTANGTAIAGQDYVGKAGSLTLPAGASQSETAYIPIINDDVSEPDETVLVYWQGVSPPVLTFTITDTLTSDETKTLPEGVENLQLTGTSSIDGVGNSGPNTITGNSNNNRLDGGGGNDTIVGGDGSDTLIGGAGDDILTCFGQGLGRGEIDSLTGGSGRDTFILTGAYTNGGSSTTEITASQLKQIMPVASLKNINRFVDPLNAAMQEFGITTPARQQAFIAQLAHESGSFRYDRELWGPTSTQRTYEPPFPKAKELGNTRKGDGFRYRGRGLLQLTGRANYRSTGKALGLNLEANPDLVLNPQVSARVAAYFWKSRGLNELADAGNFRQITLRVNGGYNGYKDRLNFYNRAKQTLASGTASDTSYAVITDFNPSEDIIRLGGSITSYKLQPTPNGVAVNAGSEVVAIIQGNTQGLSLSSNSFQFG